MSGDLVYAYRVMRLPLLDSDGAPIGRIDDIVVVPSPSPLPPRVVGFVASSQRRKIFLNAGRVLTVDPHGVRLRSWDLDLNPFTRREGEILVAADLLDRRIGQELVTDLALRPAPGRSSVWEVVAVALSSPSPLRRRRRVRIVEWTEVPSLFAMSAMAAEVAELREMHPSDVAARVRSLPLTHRRQLAEVMEDERLADLLEELPEAEQLRIIEGLDIERLLSVLDEMESDDAADLLAEMPGEQRSRLLAAMEPDDADLFRRLLSYGEGTAGHLMTPDPVVLGATSTVAEALARIRDPDLPVAVAAQVFVTHPPFDTPTGTYLGVVHFQRLLREAPGVELAQCLEEEPTIAPDLPDREVAEQLAAYNLLSIAVCDAEDRLLGVVTVDDVLDRTLPVGWRQRQRQGTAS